MLIMGFPSRVWILAVVLAANSWMAAQTPPDLVGTISSALRSQKFQDALHLLEPAIEKNPKNAQLWTLRGIALSGTGDKMAALASFRHGLSLAPDYLPALEGAAQIEYESGAKEAVAHLRRILELRPDDPTSHAMLAVLAARRGDCATAVAHFEKSGALLDSQPDAVRQYGACLVRLKQPEKAIGVFEHAVARSDTATTRCQLATVQMLAHRPTDAIETLQPLLQENAASSDVRELAATAYEAAGNTPEAVGILRQAIVADPHNVNLYLDFANISLDHQSYQVGIDMIDAGLKAEPRAAPLYVARGILYVQLAQYDKAEADFTNANSIDPKQSVGSAAEGLAAVQENDPDSALLTVRTKLAKKPNDAFLLYLQAEILAQRGPHPGSAEFREAMDSAKKAIALNPSLAAAHDILAKLYLQTGDSKNAVEQSRKALASDPKDQTALYRLIQALRKNGQNDDIPELLKQLAELRMESTKEEAERNRYKLVEQQPSSGEIHP
jgi:tetratricopeptide (TPR) repeat protein